MAPKTATETDENVGAKNGHVAATKRRVNPNLVLLKMSLFLIFGATSSLVPYLTVHMQSLGLTVAEIATVYLTLLGTTCLSPPITGYLVDRFGRYKPVLLVAMVLNIVSHHALDHFVPRRAMTELRTVVAKEHGRNVAGREFAGPSCLTLCPELADSENTYIQFCSPGGNASSQIELTFFNAAADSLTPCGLVTLENCTLKKVIQNHLNVECSLPRVPEYDRTFWYYLLIRFFATTMLTATLTITDPIALTMIEQHGGDFGREKLYSSAGMAIFTPLTGLMIDYYSSGTGDTNYRPAFYTYDVLLGLSLISVVFLPVGHKQPSESIMQHLFKILRLPHVLMFIFFLFFLGAFWGFIESYLFVIMKEMGSPNYLLGLTYTVGTVASIPMMYLTGPITRWAGHVNLLVVAFMAHALRILGYSFIENPFWCFPIELNEAISCYFMWVVATTYCAVLAPNNLVATLIGVSGMVHFCLGKGVGSFVGGFLIAEHGTRLGFRYTGYIALVCGACYKLLHLVWLKKYDKPSKEEAAEHDQTVLQTMLEKRVSLVPKGEQFVGLTESSKSAA
ncbi:major facilitator superfamily domain-containing protein 6 [Culex quinquefasciatus]|uniref:major facilitator superfamily domain-containing protein 6 n=1 Tax=Culex quinquefasciatus TaxID=7176 RepID=UPI0018E36978|nr:major facilitator superfamily domain-containing protein 6 [Culex quinquefasciatus]